MTTTQRIDPIIKSVLQILEEVKIFSFYFPPFFCKVEGPPSHDQFIFVLVIGHHEESKENNNDPKQTSQIWKHLVNFSHSALDIDFIPIQRERNL